jgi:hypothetical protein
LVLLLGLAVIAAPAHAQPAPAGHNITLRNKPREPFIVRFFPERSGAYSAGPLYVIYNNGSAKLVRNERGAVRQDNKIIEQMGFDDIQLADDRQTLGWTATYMVCAQKYPCPARLVIFRDGHVIQTIAPPHGIFSTWAFLNGGTQVAAQSDAEVLLYETATGRQIANYLNGSKPDWVNLFDSMKR